MATQKFKYPRTPHLPTSPGFTCDDVVLSNGSMFDNCDVVVSEKIDGENSQIANCFYHSRSLDSKSHPSRNHMKQLQSTIGTLIPEGWRIAGENVMATHSLHYRKLTSYFYVFAIFDEENYSLAWDDVECFCKDLGLFTVPVLYRGKYDEAILKQFEKRKSTFDAVDIVTYEETAEGFVARKDVKFHYDDFGNNLAKHVRASHVKSGEHWMSQLVWPNELAK